MSRLFLPILVSLVLPSASAAAEEKLVLAHYMTDMVPCTDRPLCRWIDPELADADGSTAALGGLHQTVPMASLHLPEADLTRAVDFEIRAARQLSWWAGGNGWFFHVNVLPHQNGKSHAPAHRITVSLSHPTSEKTTSTPGTHFHFPAAQSLPALGEPPEHLEDHLLNLVAIGRRYPSVARRG